VIGERRPERVDEGERSLRDELERLQVEVRRTRALEAELETTRRERDDLAAKVEQAQESARTIAGLERMVEQLDRRLQRAREDRDPLAWINRKRLVWMFVGSVSILIWVEALRFGLL
jgi:predicted RNase H-like nuclease (RuvC/YqgF family)